MTVGFVDHDAVLALGVAPVGVGTDEATSPGQPFGIYPWAQEQLGDAAPRQLGYLTTDMEAIAALRPDLILGLSSGLTEQEYRLMDAIAPTVAQAAEYPDFFMPWPELTRSVGRALGRAEQADQLVTGVEERFARARREHPEFAGRSVAYAGVLTDGGFYVESSASPRVSILTALGFTVPAEIDDLVGELTFTEISEEQLRLLDRDVLLWEIGSPGQREAIDTSPVYQLLDAPREGRDVFVEDPLLAAAMAATSVLSVPYVIDRLVPPLTAAVDGDPTTEVPS